MSKVRAVLLLFAATAMMLNNASVLNNRLHNPYVQPNVAGSFLSYWQQHGGLAQFGYSLTDAFVEPSSINGRSYQVQYFERAVFERHPENLPPNDVQLSLLGSQHYKEKYPDSAPNQQSSQNNPYTFAATGKSLGGKFRTYWETHGGLTVQGYPISDEFMEVSELDDKPYIVQYFERAVFEYHPENAGTEYEVLLSQLGSLHYQKLLSSIDLLGIDMLSPSEGWAVGSRGVILHYQHGHWYMVDNPALSLINGRAVSSISVPASNSAWATYYLDILHYDGKVWNRVPRPDGWDGQPNALDMNSATEGWAVVGETHSVFFHYKDDTWQKAFTLDDDVTNSINMLSTQEGWAVSLHRFIHYHDGYWSVDKVSGSPTGGVLRNLSMATNESGWAVGDKGTMYHWDGRSWTRYTSPVQDDLSSVSMTSAANGWAVGSNGTLLHYNGQAWIVYPHLTSKFIFGVKMVSANEGWAVGEAGTILHYQDGVWSLYSF